MLGRVKFFSFITFPAVVWIDLWGKLLGIRISGDVEVME